MSLKNNSIITALEYILIPVIRFCLRHGLKIQSVHEVIKRIFIREAYDHLKSHAVKSSHSRICAMTGIPRFDVAKILNQPNQVQLRPDQVSRVVSLWHQSSKYANKKQKPRPLTFVGENSEFFKLVRTAGKDLNPYVILFELERSNSIEKTPQGIIFIGKNQSLATDLIGGLQVYSKDADDLLTVIEENISEDNSKARHHLRTEYDAIMKEGVPHIRKWIQEKGDSLHKEAREVFTTWDKDHLETEKCSDSQYRVVLTSFARIEEIRFSHKKEE